VKDALKKKWKEVIDSPSGSETKHFTHKDEFDQLYGTKASTKPLQTQNVVVLKLTEYPVV
jgi:hypothetical protein